MTGGKAGENERGRAFFSLVPDAEAAVFLRRQLSELKRAMPEAPVRWVRPENLHLTLRFLGEVKPELLGELEAEARGTIEGAGHFSFRIGSPAFFPDRRRPVVIASEVEKAIELDELAAMIERIALRCRLGADRFGFRPHITLGRIKQGARIRGLPESSGENARWNANEVILMRSELTESGPAYSPVHRFPLGRA